ncbi:DUF1802 family protein [Paenibacillus sp. HN-1]|uniref:DUF1802 family protein n=1 Tax=Paenibacillus TaxID=44249 RepID=UPI001CA8C1F9|nr:MULTISPECIES: DUF1802 family protein [Paenibacillus]MBY9080413.1 DUF1802 family protein [Paenibacillus sp. CGMCC 1.18879]MBY9083993.1 DUF1802 family protein [Paenibacillus sinensis]
MNQSPVALKEWASAVDALCGGDQILVLRKGGIAEETRRFELKSRFFYLFPTYEHQRIELMKEEYKPYVERSFSDYDSESGAVVLKACAEATDDLEIYDFEQLELLSPFHVWSDQLAEERLKWKAKQPLHVLLLRVYLLEVPAVIPMLPEYSGCRSWIALDPPPPAIKMTPVLSEQAYTERRNEILSILGNNLTKPPITVLKTLENENSV